MVCEDGQEISQKKGMQLGIELVEKKEGSVFDCRDDEKVEGNHLLRSRSFPGERKEDRETIDVLPDDVDAVVSSLVSKAFQMNIRYARGCLRASIRQVSEQGIPFVLGKWIRGRPFETRRR